MTASRGAGSRSRQLEALTLTIEAGIGETIDATRRLIPILAIVASTAPLLGLLGTVIGIINAFLGIASGGTGNIAAVGPGIADALIATRSGTGRGDSGGDRLRRFYRPL